ncbi:cyanophycinase [Spirosoma linguale]|uniref:Cyanophycinase n=1 Tax=Spirosoma linguale (strain ATCC 33905 / DSM 74 / LMG 10896 / Claus 1) TaxID=504472 RepID=D2QJU5_SPILD|nr:cyanophycinase [Spirosoma linguale DSM 74]
MHIRGTLIAIGGNEDKGNRARPLHVHDTVHAFANSGILYRIMVEINNPDACLEVVTTASSIPEAVARQYIRSFKKLGHKNVRQLHITSPEEADQPDILARIQTCGGILFSGGDQLVLTSVFRDTAFARLLHERYLHEPFVIAGTSAGAMVMSDLMIYPRTPQNLLHPEVDLFPGLSLIHDAIIDTHFLVRGRFRRLAFAVSQHPTHIGIGLEEDTGIIIRKGNKLEAIGSGLITLIDGRSLKEANLTVAQVKHDIFIENLLVHVLSHGNSFTLRNKKFS